MHGRRPGLSLLDAGLPRKDSVEEKMAEKDLWTAPSYFNITLCGLGDDFGAPLFCGSSHFPTQLPLPV